MQGWKFAAVAGMLGFWAGCQTAPPPPAANPPASAAGEISLREALYRYQFTNNVANHPETIRVYFLSMGTGREVDSELIASFREHEPVVKSAMMAEVKPWGVKDQKTGEPGLVFTTGIIRWLNPRRAQVDGGFYQSKILSTSSLYELAWTNGGWCVERERVTRGAMRGPGFGF